MQSIFTSSAKNWIVGEYVIDRIQQIRAAYQRDVWFQDSKEKLYW